jgi:NAD+ synthase (glutamine-hydrolysing)
MGSNPTGTGNLGPFWLLLHFNKSCCPLCVPFRGLVCEDRALFAGGAVWLSLVLPSLNTPFANIMSNFATVSAIPKKEVKPLCPELKERLALIRSKRNFSPEQWIDERTDNLLLYMKRYNLHACVVSVSGGVDSGTIAGLLKTTLNKASKIPDHPFNPANGGRIFCLAQPFHSTKEVQDRAYEVGAAFDLPIHTINRSDEYDTSMAKVEAAIGEPLKPFAKAMCKSYERTPMNYLLASHAGGVVVGTGNKDEDGYLYYYCKFGDGAVDVGLIWDLHKSQVYEVAAALGVPRSILVAAPTADLSPGQTDEEEIGATYDAVELITNYLDMDPQDRINLTTGLSEEAYMQFHAEFVIIEGIHRKGQHKADLNPKNVGSAWYHDKFTNSKTAGMMSTKSEDAVSVISTKDSAVTITLADVTWIMEYLKWPENRRQLFLAHFENNVEDRREFQRKVALVRSIREF